MNNPRKSGGMYRGIKVPVWITDVIIFAGLTALALLLVFAVK